MQTRSEQRRKIADEYGTVNQHIALGMELERESAARQYIGRVLMALLWDNVALVACYDTFAHEGYGVREWLV